MLRFLETLFKLGIFLAIVGIFFSVLMFGAKIWGFYSFPPTKENPKGATWVVSRYDDEPLFNAADRPAPPPQEEPQPEVRGMFGSEPIQRDPIEKRIIFKLPFMKWVHKRGVDTTGTH